MRRSFWVGRGVSALLGAVTLVKLANEIRNVGLTGVPGWIVQTYSDFISLIQEYLIEIPFGVTLPEWVAHAFVLYGLFFAANWAFLQRGRHAENLLTGIGDRGRGTRRGSLTQTQIRTAKVLLALTGPLFAGLVTLMWAGNVRPGPGGRGRWGDHLMIGNRLYTVRISGLYLLLLLLQPLGAVLLLLWNSVS